jgi:hypothetical protein
LAGSGRAALCGALRRAGFIDKPKNTPKHAKTSQNGVL